MRLTFLILTLILISISFIYYIKIYKEKYLSDYSKIKYCACRPKKSSLF